MQTHTLGTGTYNNAIQLGQATRLEEKEQPKYMPSQSRITVFNKIKEPYIFILFIDHGLIEQKDSLEFEL